MSIKKNIIFYLLVFLLMFIFLFSFFLWQGIYFPKDINKTGKKIFLIERGQNLFQIAQNLEKEDLIKNRYFFIFYILIKGKTKNLQAGKYELSPAIIIPEIAEKFILGQTFKIKATIPEGFTLKQISDLTGKDFSKLKARDFREEFEFLKDVPILSVSFLIEGSLEGFLFPDTYFFDSDLNEKEIAKIFLKNFDKKFNNNLRNETKEQGKTIFEIITMASLIEKEVKTPKDRRIVSGILWKRLETEMPLQVDATITYITGKKTTRISIEETKIDSPYNTYRYLGFPVGPICNPGLDSILAAIYPENSEYWYYLSTPESKTIFSKTLKEHNEAKRRYITLN